MNAAEFGQKLKAIREESAVSLEELARETKIRVPNLRLLEAGKFEDLPAEVFITGFLKAIAHYLKCDPEQLLSDYRSVLHPPQPKNEGPEACPQKPEEARSGPNSRGFRPIYIASGASAVILLFILALVLQRMNHADHRVPLAPETHSKRPLENSPEPQAVVPKANRLEPSAKAAGLSGPAPANPNEKTPAPVNVGQQRGASAKTAGPLPDKSLVIRVQKKCWLELYRGTGERPLVYHLAQPGEQIAFSGDSFRMTVGDVGAVKVWWKGKPISLPGTAGSVLKDYTLGDGTRP